jgi:hypothetical protein
LYREILQSACIDMQFDPLFCAAAHDRHITTQFHGASRSRKTFMNNAG